MAFLQRQILKRTVNEAKARNFLCSPFSTVPSSIASDDAATPQLPPFDYQPKPYTGPSADQVLQKRKTFLGPSLFYYYQKPVSFFSFFFQLLLLVSISKIVFNLFLRIFFAIKGVEDFIFCLKV